MVNLFSCGTSSFNQEDGEHLPCSNSSNILCSTPTKASKRKSSSCRFRTKERHNPYTDRGLDKFSSLLADHEEKKQKIYTRIGPEEISYIRFVYTISNDCKPVIVRMKKKPEEEEGVEKGPKEDKSNPTSPKILEKVISEVQESSTTITQLADLKDKEKDKNKSKDKKRNRLKMGIWRRPSHYLPLVMILILLSVALFGKSFAIMCTSIVWYLVPVMNGEGSIVTKRPKSKKRETAVASNKFMSSPNSVITGAKNDELWCGSQRRKSVS